MTKKFQISNFKYSSYAPSFAKATEGKKASEDKQINHKNWKLEIPRLSGAGFTLVELMIAVAMIAIIASAAITFLNPLAQIRRANDARRKSDLSQIQKALELYYQDYDRYPNELNSRIVSSGSTIDWGQPWSPYMARVPKDPAGGVYVYKAGSNNQSYMLYAWLENPGIDPPNCQSDDTKTCKNAAPASCNKNYGCNYGISSPNVTP